MLPPLAAPAPPLTARVLLDRGLQVSLPSGCGHASAQTSATHTNTDADSPDSLVTSTQHLATLPDRAHHLLTTFSMDATGGDNPFAAYKNAIDGFFSFVAEKSSEPGTNLSLLNFDRLS